MRLLTMGVICICTFVPEALHAGRGDVVKTFPFASPALVQPANSPYVFASVPSQNALAVIDATTLQLVETMPLGTTPGSLALSPDNRTLYVATSNQTITKVNVANRSVVGTLPINTNAADLVAGANDRLYVLGGDRLQQISATTGTSAGDDVGPWWMIYSGELEISADRTRLYYADHGLSPASLYQFDITQPTNPMLWESPHGGLSGSNGQDLALSPSGNFISYACGAGQGGYRIAKYRTSDMAIMGFFECGAYPGKVIYSGDDRVAYTFHYGSQIDVFNAVTFASESPFSIQNAGYLETMFVDYSGRYLFASYQNVSQPLRIIDTGRSNVPEPTSLGLVLSVFALPRSRSR